MEIEWTSNADRQMYQIAEYVFKKFGAKQRKEFLREVRHTTNLIKQSPNIGPIDPLFEDCSIDYRSVIINGLNKIIYRIDGDTIYITAFWDTRREPNNQAEVMKK